MTLLISRPSVKTLFGSWVKDALDERYATLDAKEAQAALERERPNLSVIYGNPPLLCFETTKQASRAT